MKEPAMLTRAREHLAKAEDRLMGMDGLFHLLEGLALLDTVIDDEPDAEAVAQNVGRTYSERIFLRIERTVGSSRPSEPELEHVFALLRAFDDVSFELPERAAALKIEIVGRLIDFYSEGQAPDERARFRERLEEIARGPRDT